MTRPAAVLTVLLLIGPHLAPHVLTSQYDNARTGATLTEKTLTPAAVSRQRFANPGATPAVSANGTRDGIVWLIETKVRNDFDSVQPSVLHAYEAANVSHALYNTGENSARDRAGKTVRFTVPTIANGRVYVGARGEVDVYGLLAASPR